MTSRSSAGWRILAAGTAAAGGLLAQEVLSVVDMIDKGPRMAVDSVVWTTVSADTAEPGTQVAVLDPSEGSVVLHNCITDRTSIVGPPSVSTYLRQPAPPGLV